MLRALRYIRSMFHAATSRTTSLQEADKSSAQSHVSEEAHKTASSTVSVDIDGSDRSIRLPGMCERTETVENTGGDASSVAAAGDSICPSSVSLQLLDETVTCPQSTTSSAVLAPSPCPTSRPTMHGELNSDQNSVAEEQASYTSFPDPCEEAMSELPEEHLSSHDASDAPSSDGSSSFVSRPDEEAASEAGGWLRTRSF
eukprot:TRINITY_DN69856_c0_g1_i1.p1 TRINITY_DN69856_c0_g1~~TRINITY_DN69856_c0_g1_i1.p1  ORF type:complete len:200 (-),score=25.55 TRINITY_DN69856_c0_g1_i1:95-694(-)